MATSDELHVLDLLSTLSKSELESVLASTKARLEDITNDSDYINSLNIIRTIFTTQTKRLEDSHKHGKTIINRKENWGIIVPVNFTGSIEDNRKIRYKPNTNTYPLHGILVKSWLEILLLNNCVVIYIMGNNISIPGSNISCEKVENNITITYHSDEDLLTEVYPAIENIVKRLYGALREVDKNLVIEIENYYEQLKAITETFKEKLSIK